MTARKKEIKEEEEQQEEEPRQKQQQQAKLKKLTSKENQEVGPGLCQLRFQLNICINNAPNQLSIGGSPGAGF
jgi:hypothetical protein